MRAYVSIRGSRSPRRVDRDASPNKFAPTAALALTHPGERSTTRYDLTYEREHLNQPAPPLLSFFAIPDVPGDPARLYSREERS